MAGNGQFSTIPIIQKPSPVEIRADDGYSCYRFSLTVFCAGRKSFTIFLHLMMKKTLDFLVCAWYPCGEGKEEPAMKQTTLDLMQEWVEALLHTVMINSELRHRLLWDVVYQRMVN